MGCAPHFLKFYRVSATVDQSRGIPRDSILIWISQSQGISDAGFAGSKWDKNACFWQEYIFRNYLLPFSFLVYYSDKGSSSNLVFFYTPFLFFYTPFLFFYTTFWAYSQVPLKLWLNASSRHGDTLPSVFSINKKKSHNFWHSSQVDSNLSPLRWPDYWKWVLYWLSYLGRWQKVDISRTLYI